MPKILINEKDRTSPGTPDSYGNIAVLIPGFLQTDFTKDGEEDIKLKDKVKKLRDEAIDSNGVFEINSVSDFENIIGTKVPEKFTVQTEGTNTVDVFHYGHKMAYELVKMGYPIIYKPLIFDEEQTTPNTAEEAILEMTKADFWEIFKDKASYDFRFISHGLLASCSAYNNDIVEFIEDKAELEDYLKLLNGEKDEKGEYKVVGVIKSLEDFEAEVKKGLTADQLKNSTVVDDALEQAWDDGNDDTTSDYGKAALINAYPDLADNFKDTYKKVYDYFILERASAESRIDTIEASINTTNTAHFTTDAFNKINFNIANLANYQATGNDDTNDMYTRDIPGRGDCVALLELDELTYAGVSTNHPEDDIIKAINVLSTSGINGSNGAYCALTVPSVYYVGSNDTTIKFPAAFHYLACFMNAKSLGFREWYAAAGYTRGVSSYVIDHTSVKLGEIAINALEPRNLIDGDNVLQPTFSSNVIANFRGSYYLWGNRTAEPLTAQKGGGDLVASHFLNIRQLCSTIKKQLYTSCRRFTFDPNSDTLWVNFCNSIKPTLELMKADQGIRDYKVIKVPTDKKAMLKAKIRIIPIEAVEDFDIEVSLEDSFGETAVIAN